jgi:glutamate synthase (NADPH/NADH) large chain/glutamate synthase (ferredoxin)
MLAHNGEINTIRGNRFWVGAREADLESAYWGAKVSDLKPVIQAGGSDSTSLDNTLELLTLSGRDLLHTMMMLVPSAFRTENHISNEERAFYEYHETLAEPWDGPAAMVFKKLGVGSGCAFR